MSRSKRAPVWTEGYGSKRKQESKRSANRAVRAGKDVPNGNAYKKYYNPWDICDFKIRDVKNPKATRK